MPGRCIAWVVIFEQIFSRHQICEPGFSFRWFHVPRKMPKIRMRHGILWLQLRCPHSRTLIQLVLAWNGIVLMDSRDNVTLFWLPGSVIIQNTSCLLKSHIVHGQCVIFLKVCQLGIQRVKHLITQEIAMLTQCFWMKLILIYTLFVFIQSATSSGNSLSAMIISFGKLMNCIRCSWVYLTTNCTGCSNTWKLEMSKINFTLDLHQYHDIAASSASRYHPTGWTVTPDTEMKSGVWWEPWQ